MHIKSAITFIFLALPIICFAQEKKPNARKQKQTWSLAVDADRMTDKKVCTIRYAKDKHVWYSDRDVLYVDYSKRGGVAGFQYRIDSRPPADYKLTKRDSNDSIKISVWYRNFLDGKILRINGHTVLNDPIVLDIDLVGLKEEREKMSKECELMNISYQTPGEPYGKNPEAAINNSSPE